MILLALAARRASGRRGRRPRRAGAAAAARDDGGRAGRDADRRVRRRRRRRAPPAPSWTPASPRSFAAIDTGAGGQARLYRLSPTGRSAGWAIATRCRARSRSTATATTGSRSPSCRRSSPRSSRGSIATRTASRHPRRAADHPRRARRRRDRAGPPRKKGDARHAPPPMTAPALRLHHPRHRRRARAPARSRCSAATIRTPAFMPVGTAATVKAMKPADVARGGRRHHPRQHLSPDAPPRRRARRAAGRAARASWAGTEPILTDSGGYQVMSLADLTKRSEEGVVVQVAPRRHRATCSAPNARSRSSGCSARTSSWRSTNWCRRPRRARCRPRRWSDRCAGRGAVARRVRRRRRACRATTRSSASSRARSTRGCARRRRTR